MDLLSTKQQRLLSCPRPVLSTMIENERTADKGTSQNVKVSLSLSFTLQCCFNARNENVKVVFGTRDTLRWRPKDTTQERLSRSLAWLPVVVRIIYSFRSCCMLVAGNRWDHDFRCEAWWWVCKELEFGILCFIPFCNNCFHWLDLLAKAKAKFAFTKEVAKAKANFHWGRQTWCCQPRGWDPSSCQGWTSTQKSELSVSGRCAPCMSILSEGSSHVSDSWRHERWTCECQT